MTVIYHFFFIYKRNHNFKKDHKMITHVQFEFHQLGFRRWLKKIIPLGSCVNIWPAVTPILFFLDNRR